MEFDGDTLTIDANMSLEELREFESFIRPRLEYIETIELDSSMPVRSSALITLLSSIKKTRPEITIPFLEKGMVPFPKNGTLHWICHD
ncbi:MAG: hypothetical protein AB7S65_00700 [Sulfuricurvum sp.]